MKTKRLLTVLLTVALAVILLAVGVSAETIVASGTAGDLNWSLDADGNMRLYGEGSVVSEGITFENAWSNYKNQIRTLTVEKGVTGKISGFTNCPNLVSVSLPKGITEVSGFYNCTSLTTINIPSTVTELCQSAFEDCTSLKTITLPEGITTIGSNCFNGCVNLESILLPASLKSFGANVFYDCQKLDGIWVNPDSQYFTNDDKGLLFSKDMTELHAAPLCLSGKYTIPQSVTFLYGDVFRFHTKLTEVILSDQITHIDFEAFAGCTALKTFTFPKGVTFIDSGAFMDCTALKTIYFTGPVPVEIRNAFMGVTATVYYPAGDDSWTEEIMQDYGGDLTWVEYEVDQPLKIVEQPKNTYTKAGKTVKVTMKAQGEGLKYQWYIKNAGQKKYSKSSVTSATYSCKMNEKSKDRLVYCIVTDANGESVKSKTVILREAASITQQPKDSIVQSGETAKVTVKASGDGLKYQWYIKNAGKDKFSKSSVTKSFYSTKMTDKSAGRQVYCVVTDAYGKKVQSKTVTLGMSVAITQQPESVTVAEGETAKVTIKAIGDGLKYTWYFSDVDDATFKKTSTFKGNTYSVKMSEARDGRLVYCVITDAYGNKVSTDVVSLKMK